MINYY